MQYAKLKIEKDYNECITIYINIVDNTVNGFG